jgi:hypothetical protein
MFKNAGDISSAPQAEPKEYVPHFILASTHSLAKIMVKSNGGRCSEMLFDTLTAEFQSIVQYVKKIIGAISSSPLGRYSFEVGILPSLHVTASKCRDSKLRREAIDLLRKWPAQEGVWEGYGCAEACEWVMGIEEAGDADGILKTRNLKGRNVDSIPEWNRVRLTAMVCWLHERRIWAQCTSVLPVMLGSCQIWERTFTW